MSNIGLDGEIENEFSDPDYRDSKRLWRENHREYQRAYLIRQRYGLLYKDYKHLLDIQHGACAICHKEPKGSRSMSVDHDHITDEVRGLLCQRCNFVLGVYEQIMGDKKLLMAITSYLKEY